MKFTNVSGEHRDLPTLGLMGIPPGEEFEATGDDAKNLQGNPDFERVDGKATAKTEEK